MSSFLVIAPCILDSEPLCSWASAGLSSAVVLATSVRITRFGLTVAPNYEYRAGRHLVSCLNRISMSFLSLDGT